MRKSLSVTSVFAPHEKPAGLAPIRNRNNHATGVAQNIGNNENLVPALIEITSASGEWARSRLQPECDHCSLAAFFSVITRSTAQGAKTSQFLHQQSLGSIRSP